MRLTTKEYAPEYPYNVCCDECWRSYATGTARQDWVRHLITRALEDGWTTDSDYLHCPNCPPLEISPIVQAEAMVKGRSLLEALVECSCDGAEV